jgi:multisubunit Na+/H+ antiporter MnhG subunit
MPPAPALGILVLGAVAVVAAAFALLRFYSRSHRVSHSTVDAEVEIVAPELEPLPTEPAP